MKTNTLNKLSAERRHFLRLRWMGILALLLVGIFLASRGFAQAPDENADVRANFAVQIAALRLEKAGRSPAQRKIDAQFVYAMREKRDGKAHASAPLLHADLKIAAGELVLVDLQGRITAALLDAITRIGGRTVNSHPEAQTVRAWLPLTRIEELAGRAEVRFIRPAVEAVANATTGEGVRTHRADYVQAHINIFGGNTKVDGTGIKVGVLSTSSDYLTNAQGTGDLPNSVTVLSGQSGSPGSGEGTAMMEIVHEMAPGAQLYFATGATSEAQMAANIRALQTAGCRIIIDDVTYSDESPFQASSTTALGGLVAQAVQDVSDKGVLYFSSAANSGNKTDNTSATWEGDFSPLGTVTGVGPMNNWGGSSFNKVTAANRGGEADRVNLFWSDPLGNATSDYDIYIVDAGGNVLRTSNNVQGDTTDPYETVGTINVGEFVVVAQESGNSRFLHLDVGRGTIQYSTTGSTRGHNASNAANAFCVAATPVSNSPTGPFVGGATNPVETFSSDGPRHLFYDGSGTALTPGNVSSTGGTILNKPDFTAADGVSNSGVYPASSFLTPFFGTSAAAPHAGAIAALILCYNPLFTPAQVRALLQNTTLDIMATGWDSNSGYGIVMADGALAAAQQMTSVTPTVTITSPASGGTIGAFTAISGTATEVGGTGIAGNSVNISLFHVTTGQYWDGTSWGSAPVSIGVPVNPTTGIWTSTSLPSTANGTLRTGQYSLSASTIDNVGNRSATQAGVNNLFFTVDNSPPTVSISAPASGSIMVNSSYAFSGSANDDQAVSRVILFIRRESDDTYWNGSTWVADPLTANLSSTYVSASHSWTSNFALPAPGGALGNESYDFIALAQDNAGNQTEADSYVTVNFHPQYTWTHGSLNDPNPNNQNDLWSNPENWSPYGVPPTVALVNISNDTVDATGLAKITLSGLVIGTGGILNAGEVDLAAGGTMTWSGGSFTGTLNIPVGASANFSGGDMVLGSSSVINNAGTIVWGGAGRILGYNNSTINNLATGTFLLTADGTVLANIYSGNAFNNAGLIEKSGGSGTSELDTWTLVSSGTLKADTGILDFDQGLTLNDQSVIAGASLVTASGGNLVMTGTMNIDTVTFEITGAVATSGTATLVSVHQGGVQWTAGQIGGTLNIDPTMVLTIVGGGNPYLGSSAILNNSGKIVWLGGGAIGGYNNSTINNLAVGTFQMTADGPVFADIYGGNTFNNAGLFTKIGGTGTTSIDAWTFNNTGTINATGGLIEYDNLLNLNADTAFTGAGSFELSATVTAAAGVTLSLGTQVVLAGGTLNPADSTNPPILLGSLSWTAGTINGTWTIPSGSTLNVSGSDAKILGSSAVLNNSGTINWLGGSPIDGYNNSTINNLAGGTFQMLADGAAFVDIYGGNVFNNAGLFVKTSGPGTMLINAWTFNNGGTIRVTSGVMEYDNVLNLNAGNVFAGAGSIRLNGTITAAAGVSLGDQIVLAGGTFNSADSTNPPHILAGTLSWTSGTMTGTWTIAAGATLNVSGSDAKILSSSAVLDNYGTVNWLGGGPIQGYNNSTILNEAAASFVVQADGAPLADIYGGNQFTNQGSFIKKVTNGATVLSAWRFDNDAGGVVNAQTGSINFANELHLNGGGTLLGNAVASNSITTDASTIITGTTLLNNIDFQLLGGALSGDPTAGFDASNGGHFLWSGGSISGSLAFSQRCVTSIAGAGGTLLASSSAINNAGQLSLLPGAALAGYNNSSLNILAGGSFTIEYGGTLANYYGGNVLSNAGALNVAGGMGASSFSGWGFTQSATGILDLQIGGAPAGSSFDSLQFGETASLGGTLNVSLVNNYLPNPGDTFPLLTYGSATGQFATVNAPGFIFKPLYDANDFSLVARSQPTVTQWRAGYFADPNSPMAADTFAPSGDNISNLLKYALGLNPYLSGDAALPAFGTSGVQGNFTPSGFSIQPSAGSHPTLGFRRLEPAGVTYIVQAASSLSSPIVWSEIARLTSGQETWTGTASVTETGTGSTRFVVVTDASVLQSTAMRFFD